MAESSQFLVQVGMNRMPLPSHRPPYLQPLHQQPQPQLIQQQVSDRNSSALLTPYYQSMITDNNGFYVLIDRRLFRI
jgi:hypothetical protein